MDGSSEFLILNGNSYAAVMLGVMGEAVTAEKHNYINDEVLLNLHPQSESVQVGKS
jgi:hypothetical protein